MTYISFERVRVSPGNAKRAGYAAIIMALWIIVAVVGWLKKDGGLYFVGATGARVCMLLVMIMAVPGIVVPLGLLLAPFFLAVYGVAHDYAVWTTWWFWLLTAVCVIAGGFAVMWFATKYQKPRL